MSLNIFPKAFRLDDWIEACERLVVKLSEQVISTEYRSIQDKAILSLFIDQIETSRSILYLLEKNHQHDVDSLHRTCLEQYIYLNAVASDADVAWMYSTYCIIENGKANYNLGAFKKGEIEVLEHHSEVDGIDYSISKEELLQKIEQYNSKFPPKAILRKWYNVDGKTPGMKKLIKKLNLNPSLMADYASLSLKIHASKTDVLLGLTLKNNNYSRFHYSLYIDLNQVKCSNALLESYNCVCLYFGIPIIQVEDYEYGNLTAKDDPKSEIK
jgi:hypothetical protein